MNCSVRMLQSPLIGISLLIKTRKWPHEKAVYAKFEYSVSNLAMGLLVLIVYIVAAILPFLKLVLHI